MSDFIKALVIVLFCALLSGTTTDGYIFGVLVN